MHDVDTLNPEIVDRYVAAWYEISLREASSRSVAHECNLYCGVIDAVSEVLEFDDEPSDFRHALAGRHGWRGGTR